MHKFLYFVPLLIAAHTRVCAQPAPGNNFITHAYYIRLSGINSRQDVKHLQNLMNKKPEINLFMANRFPVRYFLMKSGIIITYAKFKHFLSNSSTNIELYEEGEKGREKAILAYNKLKAQR